MKSNLVIKKIRKLITKYSKATIANLSIGITSILILIIFSLFAEFIAPYDPYAISEYVLTPPNEKYFMGTDQLGRDVWSRTIHGTKYSVSVALTSVLLAAGIGTVLALISGYFGGKLDRALVIVMDIIYSFPTFILALLIAVMLGPGFLNIAIAVAAATIPVNFRVVRSITLVIKEKAFIEGERSIGAGDLYIIYRHIFPRCLSSLVVLVSLGLANAIMWVAALGFLGVGLQPPTPEWGTDLNFARRVLTIGVWWASISPSVMVILAVWGFNLTGEGLREVLGIREETRL